MLKAGSNRVAALLKSKENELHLVSPLLLTIYIHAYKSTSLQLANALIEYETLDMDEVKKVIKGEPIRNLKEIIQEDLSQVPSEKNATSAPVPAAVAASSS